MTMKHASLFFALITLLITSCGTQGNKGGGELKTDSMTVENKTKAMEITVTADFPTAGNAALTNSICEYISEELGGTYRGDVSKTDSMLAYYVQTRKAALEDYLVEEAMEDMPPLYNMAKVMKRYETDKFVTYISTTESYYGGAHGMHTAIGTTIRKSDGRRFGQEMLIKTDSDGFRAIIKEGLREYFSDFDDHRLNDEELKNALLTDNSVDYLPLPQFAPTLEKPGVVFTYQPYEIAPYAAGMPSFTVPYDKMKPYLTAAVLDMLGM